LNDTWEFPYIKVLQSNPQHNTSTFSQAMFSKWDKEWRSRWKSPVRWYLQRRHQ